MSEEFPYERAERRNRQQAVVLGICLYALCLLMSWFAYGPVIGFLVCTPMLCSYLAWVLMYRGDSGLRFFKWLALRRIDGRLHYFDDTPVIVEERLGLCRVAARDVFAVLREPLDAPTLRRLQLHFGASGFFQDEENRWWFAEDAALAFLRRRAQPLSRPAQRFHDWLQNEAFAALHRKVEVRAGPPTTEILAPAQARQPSGQSPADPGTASGSRG